MVGTVSPYRGRRHDGVARSRAAHLLQPRAATAAPSPPSTSRSRRRRRSGRARSARWTAGHAAQRRGEGAVGRGEDACTGRATATASRDGCIAPPHVDPSPRAIRWSSSSTAGRPARARRRAGRRAGRRSLPSQGYFVFLPNPRGSFGRARPSPRPTSRTSAAATCATSWRAWTPPSHAAPIDPRARRHRRLELRRVHVDVGGHADGPLQGRGVAGAGIANWQSYYGQNQHRPWMLPFFGASVYDDPRSTRSPRRSRSSGT